MDQSVNPFLDADKHSKIGDVFDLAFDNGAGRIIFTDQIPGVRLQLFHAERDALGIHVDIEDDHLGLFPYADNLGWMPGLF